MRVLQAVVVASVAVAAVFAQGELDPRLESCPSAHQYGAAVGLCGVHGHKVDNMACVCQQSTPVCLTTDVNNKSKPQACDEQAHAACAQSCSAASLVAIRCDGPHVSKCVGLNPDYARHIKHRQ